MTGEAAVVRDIQSRWAALFAAKDWAGLSGLYTEHPAFFGSTPELNGSRAAVRAYFETLPASLLAARFATPVVTPLGPDCLAASGPVVFVAAGATNQVELAFRMTQVLVREAGSWHIAVHHASASPGPLLGE